MEPTEADIEFTRKVRTAIAEGVTPFIRPCRIAAFKIMMMIEVSPGQFIPVNLQFGAPETIQALALLGLVGEPDDHHPVTTTAPERH